MNESQSIKETLSVIRKALEDDDIENIKNNDDIAVITGTHTFDRTIYDIKYKSKSIFGDLGDKFINDEIKLEFNIVLKEAKMN